MTIFGPRILLRSAARIGTDEDGLVNLAVTDHTDGLDCPRAGRVLTYLYKDFKFRRLLPAGKDIHGFAPTP